MKRYIDANKLMDIAWEHMDDNALVGLQNALDELPTANVVEVVHGKWIHRMEEVYCSECNFRFYPVMFKYCPGCGAKMG